MATAWSEHLRQIDRNEELRIAAYGRDGTLRAAVPVWSVVQDGAVFIRGWYRKKDGWNDVAAQAGRAQIHLDEPIDVLVADEGAEDVALRRSVDEGYRRKYRGRAGGMISDAAAATTLRLLPGTR